MTTAQTASGRHRLVVKIGTSSLTDGQGRIDEASIAGVVEQVERLRRDGVEVVVVTSGAIAAGLPQLGVARPTDAVALQAVATVGQIELMRVWSDRFRRNGLHAGQVLLAPLDFMVRQQYVHARETLDQLLSIGVVPVVNENDAIADDEIRFGDNDRLAALVAHLVRASVLVLLTDTPGLLTGDPRLDPAATLIEEIVHVDEAVQRRAGAAGSVRGSGGMASKLAAAKIAAWTGVRTVIADAGRPGVLADAWSDVASVGTTVVPHDRRLSARKLWIAFAVSAAGQIQVDDGARRAVVEGGRSLLAAGVREVRGDFARDQAVELAGPDGEVFAKGLVRASAAEVRSAAGRRSADLPNDAPAEVVHRDDLVILPD